MSSNLEARTRCPDPPAKFDKARGPKDTTFAESEDNLPPLSLAFTLPTTCPMQTPKMMHPKAGSRLCFMSSFMYKWFYEPQK